MIKDFKDNNLKENIEMMHERSHKFLGTRITHITTSRKYFQVFQKKLEDNVKHIDYSKVRGEQKLAINDIWDNSS